MEKINKFINSNPKYLGLKKPLKAAKVCEIAQRNSKGEYNTISFSQGLLTLAVLSPAQAANLQLKSGEIIEKINSELKEEAVKKIRYKII